MHWRHFAKARHTSRTSREIPHVKEKTILYVILMEGVKVSNDKYIGYCKDITKSKELKDELIKNKGIP